MSPCRDRGFPLCWYLCKLCNLPGCSSAPSLGVSGQPILLERTPWRWLSLIFLPPSKAMQPACSEDQAPGDARSSAEQCQASPHRAYPKLLLTQKAAFVGPESTSGWRWCWVGDAGDVDLWMLCFQEVLSNAPVLSSSQTLWEIQTVVAAKCSHRKLVTRLYFWHGLLGWVYSRFPCTLTGIHCA